MPAFGFSEHEFLSMTQYLKSLTTPPSTATPAETYKNLCARCHGEKGDGHGPIALYLDPYPRDLTKVTFMNSKPEERFITAIKEGVPGTSMPPWGNVLNDEQIRELLDYIWQTFVREPRRELKAR